MFYHWEGERLLLTCRIQPNANGDGFGDWDADCVKIRVQAPPTDGRANQQLVRFLAKAFKATQADITIVSGAGARQKRIAIDRPRQLPADLPILRPA